MIRLPTGCLTNDCTGIAPDSQSYSLQDALYFNGTPISVVVNCPEGATCVGYPKVVTYPPGTFVFPNVPQTPGQPITLSLQGCQSLVSITLPADATAAQIQAAVDSIIQQVAQQQGECDEFPNYPFQTTMALSAIEPSDACLSSVYSGSIVATVNPASYPVSFNLTGGSLPAGLALAQNETTALISGIPTTAGASTFTITATAANGATLAQAFTITVIGITTASPLTEAVIDEVYSETLATSGMSGTLLWGIASGTLPVGLALNSSTGEITGTPTTLGSSTFTVFVQNATQQCFKTFSMEIVDGQCENITTVSPLPAATQGEVYSVTFEAEDFASPYAWTITGTLPDGLSLDALTGVLSGTPTGAGVFNFAVTIINSEDSCSKEFEMEIVSSEDNSCIQGGSDLGTYAPTDVVFTELSPADPAPGGFHYTYTVVSGTLPSSVVVSPAGPTLAIGGTIDAETPEGVYEFCVEVNLVPD